MIAAAFLILLAVYFAAGIFFAVPFVMFGARKIDPHAAHGSWGFRLLIFPGVAALWPLLLRRWLKGIHEPPEECNAHRRAAGAGHASRITHHAP
jgi:membrane protein implicated in regulation of membrane protease activity